MKIKSIGALCKKSKTITIFERRDREELIEQWVSNGYAAYPLSGIPAMKPSELLTMFDIPQKEQADWTTYVKPMPTGTCLDNNDFTELPADISSLRLIWHGKTLVPFYSDGRIIIVSDMYFSPLTDEAAEISYYSRMDSNGQRYIALKQGLFLRAVIMPYMLTGESRSDMCGQLSDIERMLAKEATRPAWKPSEQVEIDPETGEVT